MPLGVAGRQPGTAPAGGAVRDGGAQPRRRRRARLIGEGPPPMLHSMADGEAGGPERQHGAGTPDGFRRLWTPHRMAYIKGEGKPEGSGAGDGCPFCAIQQMADAEGLIVARGTLVFAVLNLYPYNSGHLMICPFRHVADYTD